ncbi:MAG: hypothetical protein ACO2ZP_09835 [Bacteriovoracaceae bacterium]
MIRDWGLNDLDFIYHSWIKSSRDTNPMWRGVPSSIYCPQIEKRIKSILNKNTMKILIYGDETGLILSYLVYEDLPKANVYHYAYTKGKLRKKGIMSLLTEASKPKEVSIYTHSTNKAKKLLKQSKVIIFNPFLFLEEE